MDYVALKAEIDGDPLTRGYAGMTDQQVADDMNTVYRTRNRTTMSGREIMDAFTGEKTEWDALTAVEQDRIISLCARDDLNPFGIDADIFLEAAAGSTNTIAALNAARTENISRAEELGLGSLRADHVQAAREAVA